MRNIILSRCTHPDRLRSKLKRAPTQAEETRGSILFNRFSGAKDKLTKFFEDREARKQIRRDRRNRKRKKQGLPPLEEEEAQDEGLPQDAACSELNPTQWGALWKEIKQTVRLQDIWDAMVALGYSVRNIFKIKVSSVYYV